MNYTEKSNESDLPSISYCVLVLLCQILLKKHIATGKLYVFLGQQAMVMPLVPVPLTDMCLRELFHIAGCVDAGTLRPDILPVAQKDVLRNMNYMYVISSY